jgi:histone demethylase JARID1
MENTHANEALELLDVGNDRESSAPAPEPDGEAEKMNGHTEAEASVAA